MKFKKNIFKNNIKFLKNKFSFFNLLIIYFVKNTYMKYFILFLYFIFSLTFISAQEVNDLPKELRKNYNLAEKFFKENNFKKALPLLETVISQLPNNPEANYRLGLCYFNSNFQKDKAISFLQKAVRNYDEKDKNRNIAYYYLAKTYHITYQFKKAIETFKDLQNILSKSEKDWINKIDNDVTMCRNAVQYIKSQADISITNLGAIINSEFIEHSPVISADETVLIFTSTREGGTNEEKTEKDDFYEDIYISRKTSETSWSIPNLIGENINIKGHEASIGLSVDGEQLFIYKDDEIGNGDIFSSNLEGDTWSKPKRLEGDVNTSHLENHATLSSDGKTLYFVSNRPGGLGGMDIYKVKRLPNGKWSRAENLGANINTPFDEQSPYIHPDNTTLYYSSNAPALSMGGFDILESKINDRNKWEKPKNLHYPINTTEDDIFFMPTPDGKRAYYTSVRDEGKGNLDIYLINIFNSEEKYLTVMSGIVELEGNDIPDNVEISIRDRKTDEIKGIYKPNSKTGKYLFVLLPGDYTVVYQAPKHQVFTQSLEIPRESAYQRIYKDLKIKKRVLLADGNNDGNFEKTVIPTPEKQEIEEEIEEVTEEEISEIFEDDDETKKANVIGVKKAEYVKKEKAKVITNSNKKKKKKKKKKNRTNKKKKREIQTSEENDFADYNFTIQLMASGSSEIPVNVQHLENDIEIFKGTDDLFRFCYKKFIDRNEASKSLKKLRSSGFKGGYVRTLSSLK